MDQAQKEPKNYLEPQLQRTEDQVRILEEVNVRLHEMKRIAEYALKHKFLVIEIERFDDELNILKDEYSFLGKMLYPVLH